MFALFWGPKRVDRIVSSIVGDRIPHEVNSAHWILLAYAAGNRIRPRLTMSATGFNRVVQRVVIRVRRCRHNLSMI
jgi:hypothetical protein